MTDFDPSQVLECERERLANSGLIQPHGALLFIDKASGTFRYVSANAEAWLGEPPEALLGRDGRDWLERNLPELVDLPTIVGKPLPLSGALDLGGGLLDVLISPNGAGWLLEFEPGHPGAEEPEPGAKELGGDNPGSHQPGAAGQGANDLSAEKTGADDPSAYPRLTMEPPADATQLQRLEQRLVAAVSDLTGYDRVMLYQFHPDWSGEVLAEAVRSATGTYLGLRFPASDSPASARGLYAQTPDRHIPDGAADPVPLVSRQGDGTLLDLTWSELRSVSPVHAQYLRNMRVRSSFSVSLMLEGKLWGLVACHHPEPRTIPLPVRLRCQQLASEFMTALHGFRKTAQRGIYAALTGCLGPIKASVSQGASLPEAISRAFPTLAQLLGAPSGALFIDQHLTQFGAPQDPGALETLHHWWLRHQGETVAAVDQLPEDLSQALGTREDRPHGVLAIGLRARTLGNALVSLYLLRPEEAREIAWAGNPEKPLEATPDGQRLSPRNSFDKWVEVRHGYSRAWDEDSLFAARQLREQLMTWI